VSFELIRPRADDAATPETLVRRSEEADRPADDAGRWQRIVICRDPGQDTGWDDNVDLGGPWRMLDSLMRREVEHSPVDLRQGPFAFGDELPLVT